MHPSCLPIEELEKNCKWRFARRSGPGGQHRNKVESAAIVEHSPTGTVAEANERRSQAKNREVALWRLRIALALQHRGEPSESPGECWQTHLVGGRIRVAADHRDLPAMLAELLDRIAAGNWDIAVAAAWLGMSNSQVIKLLAIEPAALALVNRHREELGMHALRA